MTSPLSPTATAVKLLATLNELTLKSFSSPSKKALSFLLVNDTVRLIRYDRALLWDLNSHQPKLIRVSSQTSFAKESETLKKIESLVSDITHPENIQKLTVDSFSNHGATWKELEEFGKTQKALWIPFTIKNKTVAGLWLERWREEEWSKEELEILPYLSQTYALAWKRFLPIFSFPSITKAVLTTFILSLIIAALFIPFPLRIVAPAEVVSKDPILVTAPLNGIVESMQVKPGQQVEKDDILFIYDKRVPLQELEVAKKQVEIAESQLNRVLAQAVLDPKSLQESAIWEHTLQKEKINLDLAEYHASQLEVNAPQEGIIAVDNPDAWRGKPVQIGERVLLITHPDKTKVTIWLSEKDNIPIDKNKPVKIILNIDPATSYEAKLIFISEFTSVTDKGIPSFSAEADWIEQPNDIKIGLKGTAILYGKKVPLFYWLLRKPWYTFRSWTGF